MLILQVTGCRNQAPVNYELYTVTSGNLEITIPETGELGSAQEVSLSAPFAGTLSQLLPEGSVVKKGDAIGRIETTTQEQERSNAQLSITEARVDIQLANSDEKRRLRENRSKQDIADFDAKIESLRLRQLKEERDPVALTQIQESLRSLEQQMEILELEARERTRLFGLGYLSRQERDQAQLQLNEARQQQKQQQAELKVLQAGPRPQEIAQQDLAVQRTRDEQRRVKMELKAQQRVAEVQRRSANARIKKFEQRAGYYQGMVKAGSLSAPAAGTVVYGKIEVGDEEIPIKSGDALQEGMQIVRLVDLKQPLVRLRVHEIDAPRIKVGQNVRLTFDSFPESVYPGKVTRLLPVASQSLGDDELKLKSFSCEVQVLKNDARLKPGMTAQAEIVTERVEQALLVPTQSLTTHGAQSWVWLMGPTGKPEQHRVTIGASDASRTQIRSGLKAGDKVLLTPLPEPSKDPKAAAEASSAPLSADVPASPVSRPSPRPSSLGAPPVSPTRSAP